mmetsp:Transcript_4842/g.10964  ORF Transcript_4842/g.10964 Transcript_4842/m.10964 type:complete len:167 (-) Transcript_4842:127-627(-)|eukprot:CAMPEP_0197901648 /NCGR_PEP_ID=MMETSP1439-20131203/51581_1 /TAXON_ID=66791 /ORGANISM="Gonyaulax spinifera, Strain CCMP409" /LENGTH=166 /DNA_ID=CAMNT_0043522627 /DNA_START=51 /DNA_END=551 /DNA_ORIENTATION=-
MARPATAKYSYLGSALDPNSISMHAGESILFLHSSPDGVWATVQVSSGKKGWVPTMCIVLGPEQPTEQTPADLPPAVLSEASVKLPEAVSSGELSPMSPPSGQPTIILSHPDHHEDLKHHIVSHASSMSLSSEPARLLSGQAKSKPSCFACCGKLCSSSRKPKKFG